MAINWLELDTNKRHSVTSDRLGSGVDAYQAGLYGLGEAVADAFGSEGAADWMREGRERNEYLARMQQQRAIQNGAVDDWRDVNGVGSGLNYLGGLAAQSLPYLGEAVVGGIAARGLMSGTRAALGAAELAGNSAEVARLGTRMAAGQSAGAAAASYPSAVGDILQNQREENGTTDLGSALVGGVPYAAMNALGIEGLAARGLKPLAKFDGNLLARMGKQGGVTALSEGIGETGQEMVNQYFGRMAVNPEQTLFNEEANKRYVDSFVGGAALGGAFGSLGGIKRPVEEQPNLLDRNKTDPTVDDRPAFNLESYGQDQGPLYGAQPQDIGGQADLFGAQPGQSELFFPNGKPTYGADAGIPNLTTQMAPLQGRIDQNLGITSQPYAGGNYPQQFNAAASEPTNQWVVGKDGLEERLDAGQDSAVRAGVPVNEVAQQVQANAQAKLADHAAKQRAAAELGLDPKNVKHTEATGMLLNAVQSGLITESEALDVAGTIMAAQQQPALGTPVAIARKAIKAAEKAKAEVAKQEAEQDNFAAKVATPATQQAETAIAGIDSNKTITIGRKGREKVVTPKQMLTMLSEATVPEKEIILSAAGYTLGSDPTTNAPRVFRVHAPMKGTAIADKLGVSRQQVSQTLQKFGLSDEKIEGIVSDNPQMYSEAELGLDAEGGLEEAGMRVEDTASKATGSGMVEGDKESAAQRRERQRADLILRLDKQSGGKLTPEDIVTALKNAKLYDEAVDGKQSESKQNTPSVVTDNDPSAQNAERLRKNIEAAKQAPWVDEASEMWNPDNMEVTDLPDTLFADYILGYGQIAKSEGGMQSRSAMQSLVRLQTEIEQEYDDYRKYTPNQGRTDAGIAGPQGGQANQSGNREIGSGGTVRLAEDSGVPTNRQNATDVEVKVKKRRVVPANALDAFSGQREAPESRASRTPETKEIKAARSEVEKYKQLLACLTR